MQDLAIFAVIKLDVETSSYREEHHLATSVSMVATHIAVLDFVSPKDAFYGEGNMVLRLAKRQTSTLVRNLGKLHKKATLRKLRSNIMTHFS